MTLELSNRQQIFAGVGILTADFLLIIIGYFSGLDSLDIINFLVGLLAGIILIYRGKFKN